MSDDGLGFQSNPFCAVRPFGSVGFYPFDYLFFFLLEKWEAKRSPSIIKTLHFFLFIAFFFFFFLFHSFILFSLDGELKENGYRE